MKHNQAEALLIANINKRNLIVVGVVVLALAISGFWYYSGESHREILKSQTDRTQREVYLWARHFQGLPQVIGKYPIIRELLENPTKAKQDAANFFLLQLTDTLGVNFAYVFDDKGTVLAASNFYNELNFIDDDYSFRPYVLSAIKGDNGSFMAVGLKTGQRGFYFSAPVRENGAITGGVALKVNIDFLTTLKAEKNTDLLFLDEKNIVFHSTSGRFEQKALTSLSENDVAQLEYEKRFNGRDVSVVRDEALLNPGLSEGMPLKFGNQETFFTGYKLPIPGMSWSVMSISDYQYRITLVAKWAGVTMLLYTAIAGFLLVYKDRRRHNREITALNNSLEIRVQQLAANLTRKNEELELSLDHYKRTQKELENTQSELIQTAKLAVLGEMAAGINHELNQPLQALIAYSQNGKKFIERNKIDLAEKNLEEIALIATNMAETVAKFKVFSRRAKPDSRQVMVSEILDNVSAIIMPQLQKHKITYRIDNRADNQNLNCEPVMIGQVLVNLISNAAHALETSADGVITVSVTDSPAGTAITVKDNGPGISEEIRDNLFEPFFTTKEKGLGLGLTISRRIVESQNGTLTVQSAEPHGTAFTLSLPREQHGENT
ncbi:ATP-binding protein [Alteromonas sp. 1_MG-2023]|uniref:ATP-binding protein n=1 Tax=Alteromonas sp. 1_MG-2023 TaxID=3062669 RepID=UPI0026E36F91|nr:ATP-binding protein [Alteromonas sp. 1_MG-2023]MDO6474098.1 ATP-binding protein [Alteromonas sp. 1_MG-2023]